MIGHDGDDGLPPRHQVPLRCLCRPLLARLRPPRLPARVSPVAGKEHKLCHLFYLQKVRHQRIEDAKASLRRLRGADYSGVELELQEIQKCCEQETSQVIKNSVFEEIKSRTFVLPMTIFTLIFALLGCTGNDTMVYLGPAIFSKAS